MYWRTLKLPVPSKAEGGMDIGFVYQLEKLENGEGFFRMISQSTCIPSLGPDKKETFVDWDSVAE